MRAVVTVLKYSIPVAAKLSAISFVVMTAAIGCPFPMGLPEVNTLLLTVCNGAGF
jgi:hypothetical protein